MKYRKDVLDINQPIYTNRGNKIDVTEELMNIWVDNTRKRKHKTFIPTWHTYDPNFNAGYAVDWEIKSGLLWSEIEINDEEVDAKINKDFPFVSIGIENADIENGYKGGWISHIALTDDPMVKNQGQFIHADNKIFLSNTPFEEGGDNVDETKNLKEWFEEKLKALKPDEKIIAERDELLEKVGEMEARITELEKVEASYTEMKGAVEKAEAEKVLAEKEKIWTEAVRSEKVAPASKEWVFAHCKDVDELTAYFAAHKIEATVPAGATEVENPNDVKLIDRPENKGTVDGLRKLGYSDEEIEKVMAEEAIDEDED